MANVFDDEHGTYLVLSNEAGEYSLWPADLDVPGHWRRELGPDTRSACLAHIEQHG